MTTLLGSRKLTKFLLIPFLILLAACSREKETATAKFYHSTTSYFNGYYNALELFKLTVADLEEKYVFPQQGFMEVVYYGKEDEVKPLEGDFETVTKKNDAIIYRHPNGNYIDNCRLLNGKAWFYRQNYTLALQNFRNVIQEYPDSKQLPDAYFWLAQTHYQMDNKEVIPEILYTNLLENDTLEIDEELRAEIALFEIRLSLDSADYQTSAALLAEHIGFIKGRLRTARAHFLLGQLYAELADFARALEQYQIVAKTAGDYELAFEAKIRIARLYLDFQESVDSQEQLANYLRKLLKDEKNIPYQDRIYYEKALLEFKKEEEDQGIDYLKESVAVNIGNNRQKALSYYKIGQVYFYNRQNYDLAQAYYDSAAAVITVDAPEYKEITNLAKTLKEYITHKRTIQYQDSMLWLASLSDLELDSVILEVVAEEKRKKEEEAERLLAQMNQNQNNSFNNPFFNDFNQQNGGRNGGGGESAVWYFDNPAAVSSGKMQFQQIWGSRANADNWRRSKSMATMGQDLAPGTRQEIAQNQEQTESIDTALVAQYGDNARFYAPIPKTAEEIEAANNAVENAMYKLGQVYSQKLNEPDSAIATFESLLDRFEGSDYTLQARYALYQLYLAQNNPIFNVHKNFFLNEHPNTVYAYLIQGRDPNELKEEEEDFKYAYAGLFNSYAQQQYQTSIGFSEFLLAQAQFLDVGLDMAQLLYIRGMSYGYIGEKDSLQLILTGLVDAYPNHDVTPLARETLQFLSNGPTEGPQLVGGRPAQGPEAPDEEDPRFKGFTDKVKPNEKVFVLMYISKDKFTKKQVEETVSNFNSQFFSDKSLKVYTFMYQQTHLLPYIRHFKSVGEAKQYIEQFLSEDSSRRLLPSNDERIFYITQANFRVAYGQKRLTDYIDYYDAFLNRN
ncbi:tetratricopeptide repeat protein [Pontibacter sp. G13]|uniref:type IX secretion system periplasmic lipoprotein PorW/SprE n=1 Tax=Pontibacter sp. G13 TaxID=3074898 RepID=UPI002889F8BB|nr:tetratricopeptide repeat protein [Pontibacter sp. G13]WNJ21398.1 tetratricopeptide repeat protein [Pontibacter sp. G13]